MPASLKSTYFHKNEILKHNTSEDCWVSFFGRVLDLSELLKQHRGSLLARPIIDAAGSDISHWFIDEKTIRTKTDISSGNQIPYDPQGHFITEGDWWIDPQYQIGQLTRQARKVKIYNTLTGAQDILEFCAEETMGEVEERFAREFNQHSDGYVWRHAGRRLKMSETLAGNGIPDLTDQMNKTGLDEDEWIPVIHLEFKDNLSTA